MSGGLSVLRWSLVLAVAGLGVFGGRPAAGQSSSDCPGVGDQTQAGAACPQVPLQVAAAVAGGSASTPTPDPGTPRTPREPRSPRSSRTEAPVADRDCEDFSTQPEAQRFFESQRPGDPHDLDRDGDGRACETLPRSAGARRGALPKTGSRPGTYGLSGSALVLAGAFLTGLARRRRSPEGQVAAGSGPAGSGGSPWGEQPLVGW